MRGMRQAATFGLEAVCAAAAAGLGKWVVGVHVSTDFCVDMMILFGRRHCQMGWPGAYMALVSRSLKANTRPVATTLPYCGKTLTTPIKPQGAWG
jgi:hypothetical protein